MMGCGNLKRKRVITASMTLPIGGVGFVLEADSATHSNVTNFEKRGSLPLNHQVGKKVPSIEGQESATKASIKKPGVTKTDGKLARRLAGKISHTPTRRRRESSRMHNAKTCVTGQRGRNEASGGGEKTGLDRKGVHENSWGMIGGGTCYEKVAFCDRKSPHCGR